MKRFLKGELKGIQAGYSPEQESVFVGEKSNLKQSISMMDKKIMSVSCTYGERIHVIGLRVRNRNGIVQRVNIGYPPLDQDAQVQTEEVDVPPYQSIRSVIYYGEIEESQAGSTIEEESSAMNSKKNNGDPIFERNGSVYIIPGNLKKNQYIKLTGISFDIIA